MSDAQKKKWSKKKKVIVIVLCVLLAFIIAIVGAGVGALNWYCKTTPYEVVSVADTNMADNENIKMIAHRGFRAMAPENTLPAFEKAGESGYWGAECDIYRTKDGVWVVQHDVNTYRMMDKTANIEKVTYDELKTYVTDNGNMIGAYPNLGICTLDEYLDACAKYSMVPVIELKGKNNTEHYDEIAQSVNKYGMSLKAPVFISFHEENLMKLRELFPENDMFYLVHEIEDESIDIAKEIGNCGIDFDGNKEKNYEDNIIEKCQQAGLEMGAWTIDDPAVMEKLVDLGVNYITTNCITY